MFSKIRDSDLREVLKGGLAALMSKGFSIVSGFALTLIIARIYGSEELGFFALANTLFSLGSILCLVGMQTSVLRLIPEHLAQYSNESAYKVLVKMFTIAMAISILASLALYRYSDWIGQNLLSTEGGGDIIRILSRFLTVFCIYAFCVQILRAHKQVKALVFLDIASGILKIVVLAILTVFLFQSLNTIYSLLISVTILCAASLLLVLRANAFAREAKGEVHPVSTMDIFRLSMPMFLTGVMSVVVSQTDVLMIAWMLDVESVGKYAVAAKISVVISLALVAMNSISTPKFSELYHSGESEKLIRLATRTTKITSVLATATFLFLVVFSEYLLLIFGEEFRSLNFCLLTLCIGQLINCLSGPVAGVLNMTGHQVAFNRIIVFSGLLNILLNYLLIPIFGIEGAALSTAISITCWNVLGNLYIRYRFGSSIAYIPMRRLTV